MKGIMRGKVKVQIKVSAGKSLFKVGPGTLQTYQVIWTNCFYDTIPNLDDSLIFQVFSNKWCMVRFGRCLCNDSVVELQILYIFLTRNFELSCKIFQSSLVLQKKDNIFM